MLQLLSMILGAALALLACNAQGEETGAPLSPTIRPILTSNDPAGDDTIYCYVLPVTHRNGSRDSPEAVPGDCVVEITDTLTIETGSDDALLDQPNGPPAPELVVDVLIGTQNDVITPGDHSIVDFPLSPGTRLGVYRFRGHVGAQPVTGGFTVRRSSKRVLQLDYKGAEVVLAGYPPGANVPVDLYAQISYRSDLGTGERKWGYLRTIGYVTVDGRGEAAFQLPSDLRGVTHNILLATEPLQQNELSSGYNIADSP